MLNDPASHRAFERWQSASGGLLDWLLILAGAALAMVTTARDIENFWR